MLTLITGTPGAGKSLLAVWEFARKVPGTTLRTEKGDEIPRRLLTNIKDLVVDHQLITSQDLENWQTWAKPGDVIIFDEVQEVWRGRGLNSKVPDCIQALEVHRHMGVDLVLITQHPGLIDPNIRKLVNQHIHVRRISKRMAWQYEWDHCGQPGQYRSCTRHGFWRHPKGGYALYKSSQLHTKPTQRLPAVLFVGLAAVVGLAYFAPVAFGRITSTFQGKNGLGYKAASPAAAASAPGAPLHAPGVPGGPLPVSVPPGGLPGLAPAAPARRVVGCVSLGPRCECFDSDGGRTTFEPSVCGEASYRVGGLVRLDLASASPAAVPGPLPSPAYGDRPPGHLRPGESVRLLPVPGDNKRGPQSGE